MNVVDTLDIELMKMLYLGILISWQSYAYRIPHSLYTISSNLISNLWLDNAQAKMTKSGIIFISWKAASVFLASWSITTWLTPKVALNQIVL